MAVPANLFTEFELTYLARQVPEEIAGVTPKHVADIYFPEAASRPPLRLRQRGELYEITKKIPVTEGDYSKQTEQTIPLEAEEFATLMVVSKRKVSKDRYTVTIDGAVADVDLFTDSLKGLVLIDFEFEDEAAKAGFVPPACCLADVTQELFVAGGQLAGKSYQDIASELERFGYKALAY